MVFNHIPKYHVYSPNHEYPTYCDYYTPNTLQMLERQPVGRFVPETVQNVGLKSWQVYRSWSRRVWFIEILKIENIMIVRTV